MREREKRRATIGEEGRRASGVFSILVNRASRPNVRCKPNKCSTRTAVAVAKAEGAEAENIIKSVAGRSVGGAAALPVSMRWQWAAFGGRCRCSRKEEDPDSVLISPFISVAIVVTVAQRFIDFLGLIGGEEEGGG